MAVVSKPFDVSNIVDGIPKPLDAIRENPEKFLQLQILVCGQTGIGKSSLVNSILRRELCKVGDPGKRAEGGEFAPETTQVTASEGNLNGIIVTIWDSPGLQDGCNKDDVYLKEIYEKCSNVDLVLYCVDMTTTRWTSSEETTLKLMSEKFPSSFWSKCLLILTKANMVRVPVECKNDKRGYHERIFRRFSHQFRKKLVNSIPQDIVDKIPVVAAGLVEGDDDDDEYVQEERCLYYISDTEEQTEFSPFLPVLVKKCRDRLNDEGKMKFYHATRQDVSEPEEASAKAINLDDKTKEKIQKFYEKHEKALNPPIKKAANHGHQRPLKISGTSAISIAKAIKDLKLRNNK